MGSIPFDGPLPHRYTTLDNLRAAGISTTSLPDAEALRIIEVTSNLIDRITDQSFVPILQALQLNGPGDEMLHHPKLLPILKILEVALLDTTGRFPYTTNEFSVSSNRRYVRREPLIGITGRRRIALDPQRGATVFPRGIRNIELNAIFGWLENFKEIQTKTESIIAPKDVSVEVESIDGILVNDVFIAKDVDNNFATAIVSGIDLTNNQLNFDTLDLLSKPVASGADLFVFGRVPLLIERVCHILVSDMKDAVGSSSASRRQFQSLLLSERTDNYSYSLRGPSGGASVSNPGASTGNVVADNLLAHFVAPPMISFG